MLAVPRKLRTVIRVALLPVLVVLIAWRVKTDTRGASTFLSEHAGYIALALIVVGLPTWWFAENSRRRSVIRKPSTAGRSGVKPLLRPLRRAWGEWVDLALAQDDPMWRAANVALLAAAVVTPLVFPLSLDDLMGVTSAAPEARTATITAAVKALSGPVAWVAVVWGRDRGVGKQRLKSLASIQVIAKATLKYPRQKVNPTPTDLALQDPWTAVQVDEWESLTEPRTFRVMAPPDLSVTDMKARNEFAANINMKLNRPDGLRVSWAEDGSGALVTPANYPLAVTWDGAYDDDPLTFYLGINLDTTDVYGLTLGEVSPHGLFTGATSSGKTSLVEIIAAQVLLKPMPWDETLRGTVEIVDPKGPLANRWEGRPGVRVSRGNREGVNEDGDEISGFEVMRDHMEIIELEHKRRAAILDRYPAAGSWVDLSDEVKREEQLAPLLIVLDEYLDHTSDETGSTEQIERDNAARERIRYLTTWWHRKGRNVGLHVCSVLQMASMTDIGGQMKRNAAVRVIMGKMDEYSYKGMFGVPESEVPILPTSRTVRAASGKTVTKTIPGRGLIQNATGQKIHPIQAYWFGGPTNSDVLDRLLPRSTPGAPADPDTAGLADADGDGLPDGAEILTTDPTLLIPDGVDPDAIFPAANASAALCGQDGCADDATAQCGLCSELRCHYHLGAGPDPDTEEVCADCATEHPLVRAGLGSLYRETHAKAGAANLDLVWVADPTTGTVTVTVRRPGAGKVLELVGDGQNVTVRSRGGTATGAAAADQLTQILAAYQPPPVTNNEPAQEARH